MFTTPRFSQGFELGFDGFLDSTNGWSGTIGIFLSGTNGIPALSGGNFAIFEQSGGAGGLTGPFTRFGGSRALDEDQGVTTKVSVFLDPAKILAGEGFDYSVAANSQSGSHLQDFIFHVTHDTSEGVLQIGASNNTNFEPREDLETLPNFAQVTTAGWYTFEHTFQRAGDGTLEVVMTVTDETDAVVFTQTIPGFNNGNPIDFDTEFGGQRYGWFTNIDVAAGIAVEDATLLSEDTNPVQVFSGNTIVDTFLTAADAIAAIDAGTVVGAALEITGEGDAFFYVSGVAGMSIQDAVDAADLGQTVLVGDGTFVENVQISQSVVLLSQNGRASTTIEGISGAGALGAVQLLPGANDVQIGDTGQGFHIIGIDNGNGAIENAAVYLQGAHSDFTLRDNEVEANGEHGLASEFGATVTNLVIDGNEFSGQTFQGANPGGIGFSTQFNAGNNVPRQLVVLGNGGTAPQASSNVTFTNNLISGTTGGISSDDGVSEQGNTMVTIDVNGATIDGNTFTGTTARFATGLRARGPDTDITNNTFDNSGGGDTRGIFTQNQNGTEDVSGNSFISGDNGDLFQMSTGDDSATGGAGDDTFVGNAGDDDIAGGGGKDISGYTGVRADYGITVTTDGNGFVTAFTVVTDNEVGNGNEGSDTLDSIEVLAFSDVVLDTTQPVQLFDASDLLIGTFDTIQAAVDAAPDGATVLAGAGTFTEQVLVDGVNGLTIRGAGEGVTTVEMAASPVFNHTSATDGGSRDRAAVITVRDSADVVIENLTVDGLGLGDAMPAGTSADFEGVLYFDASGAIQDITVTGVRDALNGDGTPKGNQRGNAIVVINDDGTARSVDVTDNTVTDFQKNGITVSGAGLTANVDGNEVTGAGFLPAANAIAQNGIQVSGGAGGVVNANTISEIGYQRDDFVTAHLLVFTAADGLQVTNNIINGTATPSTSAGIFIIDADNAVATGNQIDSILFGLTFQSIGAGQTVENPTISGNTFTNAIESIQALDGGSNPPVNGALFTGSNIGVFAGDNTLPVSVEGSDGVDELFGTPQGDSFSGLDGDDLIGGEAGNDELSGGAGNDSIDGGEGNDRIEGGLGDDTYIGGSGDDIAVIADNGGVPLDLADFDFSGLTVTAGVVSGTLTGPDGTETLDGIEFLEVANTGSSTFIVLEGMSIQAAIDAAAEGDTVVVTAGTFTENLVIDKSIELLGAQAGVAATGATRAGGETILNGTGTFAITVLADNVTVDGFELTDFGRDGINVRTLEDAKPGDASVGAFRTGVTLSNNWIHEDAPSGQRNGIVLGEFSGDPARSTETAEIEDLVLSGNFVDLESTGGRGLILTNHFAFIGLTNADIDGNTFDAATAFFGSAGPDTFRIDTASLTDNTFGGTVNSYNFFSSTIDGNTFNGVSVIGIDNTTVSDNTFNAPDFFALGLWGSEFGSNVSQNSTLSGNTFNYNIAPSAEQVIVGLRFRDGADEASINLDGNTFNNGGVNAGINATDVRIDGSAGDDVISAADLQDSGGTQVDVSLLINGFAGNDDLTGGDLADALFGGDDDDRLTGGLGDDSFDGGDGSDVAVISDNGGLSLVDLSGFDFSGLTVTAGVVSGTLPGPDGTETLAGIEVLEVANTGSSTFVVLPGMSIQAAVDAAAAGDTIRIEAGTFAEAVTIDKALTIIGAGAGLTIIEPPAGSGFDIDGDLGTTSTLSIDGITFQNSDTAGIAFDDNAILGTLSITNSSFTGNFRNGVAVGGNTGPVDLDDIVITDSTFTGNGGDPASQTSSGDGDILLFQYNGDATIQNVAITGQVTGSGPAENGIQFRGDVGSLGTVVLDNITIDGVYEKQPIAFFNYDDVNGLSATGVVITADSTGFQISGNFDGIGGDIDNSAGGIDTTGAPDPLAFQGADGANTLTGGAEDNILRGNDGDDELNGGDGFDTAVYGGNSSDFTIVPVTDPSTGLVIGFSAVTDNNPGDGDEGADTLDSVEALVFAGDGVTLDATDPVQLFDSSDNLLATFDNLKDAVDAATGGETIRVAAGSVSGGSSQIVIDVDLTIEGVGKDQTTITSAFDTGGSGDARGWFLVNDGVTVDVLGMTFDGTGNLIHQAFRHKGSGTFDDVGFNEIKFNESGPTYAGTAIAAFGTNSDVDVTNSTFAEIGRVGVLYFGATTTGTFQGNSYTGKGDGDFLDYALDISAGANIEVLDNIITDNRGVASADGSVSAGVLISTFFAGGTTMTIAGNTFTDNSTAIFSGFNSADTSTTTIGAGNTITGGDQGLRVVGDGVVGGVENLGGTGATVDWDGGAAANVISGAGLGDELSGGAGNDDITGGGGNDTLDGGEGDDAMAGGDGDDLYFAETGDTITENADEGIDEVRSTTSITLSANVENLTLLDLATAVEDFEGFDLGPIENGENGWVVNSTNRDQEIIDDGTGNKAFKMSSDPSLGDFAGPYSPALDIAAGEPQTTAGADGQQISFDFKAVDPDPADNSRLEVDFGNTGATDRNNFMVIENTGTGIRIAVADALLDGNFVTDDEGGINDFAAFTGNRTLIEGVDPTVGHSLTMVVNYFDGPDNDVIKFYLDGQFIGESTTFENFRDALGGDHATNAEANQTSRLFFRPSAGGAATDGTGGVNEGFTFDNIQGSAFAVDGPSGTGNDLGNIITGTSGNNSLSGLGGSDTINAGLGDDTIDGGDDDDVINAGGGFDVVKYAGNLADHSLATGSVIVTDLLGSAGTDTLTGVERIDFADASVFIVGGDSEITSIQDAVDQASAGDVIFVQPGTYDENVTINKQLTILGANAGVAGSDAGRGAESVLNGALLFSPGADGSTVDGMQVQDGAALLGDRFGVFVQADDITITNSLIARDPGLGEVFRGILTAFGQAEGLVISDSMMTGWTTGAFINPGSDATITGNTFQGNGAGISNDGPDAIDISGNIFIDSTGSHIALGAINDPTDGSAIVGANTFQGTGREVSFFALGNDGQVIIGTDHDDNFFGDVVDTVDGQTFTGGLGEDLIYGGGGNDSLDGEANQDVVYGGDGDDIVSGGGNADSLFGGNDDDQLFGGTGADFMDGGAGNDLLDGGTNLNTMDGGDGDDRLIISGEEDADGGDGIDTAVLTDFTGVSKADLLTFLAGGAIDNPTVPGTTVGFTGSGADLELDGTVTGGSLSYQAVTPGVTIIVDNVEILEVPGAAPTDPVTYLVVEGMSIQEAIDASSAGDTILVGPGVYAEDLEIPHSITLCGATNPDGSPAVQIGTGSGNAINISATDGGTVGIEGIVTQGGARGINVDSGTTLAAINVDNVDISGTTFSGFSLIGEDGVASVSVTNSVFSDNGTAGANGSSDLLFFDYHGDITLTGLELTGSSLAVPNAASMADVAIQIAGFDESTRDVDQPIGTVTISDLTVTGNYDKWQVLVQGYNDLSGLTFSNVSLEGATRFADLLFIDPIATSGQGPAGVPGGAGQYTGVNAGVDVTLDLSGVTITNLGAGATEAPFGFVTPLVDMRHRGSDADDIVTGTNARDLLGNLAEGNNDFGGDDEYAGLAGNDVFVGGAGNDTLDGGDDQDMAIYEGDRADYTVTFNTDAFGFVTEFTSVTDNEPTGFDDGADTLISIELLAFAGDGTVLDAGQFAQLFDANGDLVATFDTLQEAADAALDGFTIRFQAPVAFPDPTIVTLDAPNVTIETGAGVTGLTIQLSANALGFDIDSPSVIDIIGDDIDQAFDYSAGDGDDDLETGASNDIVDGDEGNNTIVTGGGDDIVTAGAGNDSIDAGDGADTITSGDGDDQVFGGIGADIIVGGVGGGNDLYNGGAGTDTVSYASTTAGVTVDLRQQDRSAQALTFSSNPAVTTMGGLLAGFGLATTTPVGFAEGSEIDSDALISIENVTGGAGNDTITGNSSANTLLGGDGEDVIAGGAGADSIAGGAGNDTIDGGAGDDSLDGGAGIDTLDYSARVDDVVGNLSTIVILSTQTGPEFETLAGFENILTGAGEDNVQGDANANLISTGAGDDILTGGLGNDTLIGGDGVDVAIFAGNLADYVIGGLNSTTQEATISGPDGDDVLSEIETARFDDVDVHLFVTRADAETTLEDTPVTIDVLTNDDPVDGTVLDVTSVRLIDGTGAFVTTLAVTGGTFTVNTTTGEVTFTPDANFDDAVDVVSYVVSDTDGALTLPAEITVTITPVNDAPTTTPAGATIDEEGTHVFALSDFGFDDPNDDPANAFVNVLIDTLPGEGTLALDGIALTGATTVSASDIAGGLLTYTGALDDNGLESFDYRVQDDGGTDNGGEDTSTSATFEITINQVNDAPVLTVPGGQSVDEDGSVAITGISVADVDFDEDGGTMTATLTAANGTVSVTGSGSVVVSDNGTATVTLTATDLAELNTVLGSVVFSPDADFNDNLGSASLTVAVDDGGASGSGGALTDSEVIAVSVNAVNDGPELTVPGAQTTDEDTGLTILGISAADLDVDEGTGEIQAVLSVTNGTITVDDTGVVVVGNGTSTMTITGTLAEVNDELAGVNYAPNADFNGSDTLDITISDLGNTGSGGTLTATDSVDITINAVNDAPVLDNDDRTISATEDTSVILGASDFAFTDVEGDSLLEVVILTVPTDGTLELDGLVLLGGETVTAVQLADGDLVFVPGENDNNLNLGTPPSFTFQVVDDGGTPNGGDDTSETGTISFDIAAVNDGPDLTVPGAQTTDEDTGLAITGISFTDVDVDEGTGQVQAVLSVTNGTITVDDTDVVVTGNGTSAMTITGSLAEVNDELAGLIYNPDADFNGSDTLDVTVSDLGNAGAGGTLTATDSVDITISSVDDAPVGEADTITTDEDVPVSFSGFDFGFTDPADAGSNAGANNLAAVIIESLPGAGVLALDGTPVLIGQTIVAADFGDLVYTPNAETSGDDSFDVTVIDDGIGDNTAAAANTITVSVATVNDPPVIVTIDDEGAVTEIADGAPNEGTANLTDNGVIIFTDADSTVHSISASPQGGSFVGTFTPSILIPVGVLGPQGIAQWQFSVSDSELQSLNEGEVVAQVYDVTITDIGGASTTDQVTITLTGRNDAPTVANVSGTTDEDTVLNFLLGGDDLDDEDDATTLIYTIIDDEVLDGSGNNFFDLVTIVDGELTFDPTADLSGIIEDLETGESLVLTFQYTAEDARGAGSNIATGTITINGVTDNLGQTFTGEAGIEVFNGTVGLIDTVDYSSASQASAGLIIFLQGADGAISTGLGGNAAGDQFISIENIIGTAFDDLISGSQTVAIENTFFGGGGSDVLDGGLGEDVLFGGAGDDFLFGADNGTTDTLDGGTGLDTVAYSLSTTGIVYDLADPGAVTNSGEILDDVLISIEGVSGSASAANTLFGDGQNNLLIGGSEADSLDGRGGSDVLIGFGGDDTIAGGDGIDVIQGGAGTDILTGGAGADVFFFQADAQTDIITDFSTTDGDLIQFFGTGAQFSDLSFQQVGLDVEITVNSLPGILIVAQNQTELVMNDSDNFSFV